jgi:hypothetical protein
MTVDGLYLLLTYPNSLPIRHFEHFEEGYYRDFVSFLKSGNAKIVKPTTTLLSWRQVSYGKNPYVFLLGKNGVFDFGCRTPFLDDLRFGMSEREYHSVLKKHMKLSCYDDSSIFYLGYMEPFRNDASFDVESYYVMERGKVLELPKGCTWATSEFTQNHTPTAETKESIAKAINSTVLRKYEWNGGMILTFLNDWMVNEKTHEQVLSYKIFLDEDFVSVTNDGNPKYMFELAYLLKRNGWKGISSELVAI